MRIASRTMTTLALFALLAGAGCFSSSDPTPPKVSNSTTPLAKGPTVEEGKAPPKAPLQPYDAPALKDLDAKVTWKDRPVVDSMKLRWEAEKDKRPLVSVEEALALRNDSQEANDKILSALGAMSMAHPSTVDWDAAISRRLSQDLRSTNPLLQSSVSEAEIAGLTGTGLFGFDWDMNPFAVAASVKTWQTSEDGLYDKVVMRDDLTWSDGEPITAHDVVFSFQTILDPDVSVPAVEQGTNEIRWVEAYDDQTLVFFHKQALATNIWNINFPVIPKHIYEKSLKEDKTLRQSAYHAKLESKPVTGGPYEIVRRTRGQEIVLQRRDSYYMHNGKQVRDKPYFKQIVFKIIEDVNTTLLALKSGEIEESELGAEQWQTQTSGDDYYNHNTKITGPEWTYFYFGWNLKTPFFNDVRVRKAMSYAFNHQEMLRVLCYGLYQPCTGIYHPDAWMAPKKTPAPYHQDLDKAEDLLDAAGWNDSDGDGVRDKKINGLLVPFEFQMMVSNKPDRIAICTLLKENLQSIGVICNIAPLEAAVLQENIFKRKFEASMAGWGAGADPDTSQNIWGTGQAATTPVFRARKLTSYLRKARKNSTATSEPPSMAASPISFMSSNLTRFCFTAVRSTASIRSCGAISSALADRFTMVRASTRFGPATNAPGFLISSVCWES